MVKLREPKLGDKAKLINFTIFDSFKKLTHADDAVRLQGSNNLLQHFINHKDAEKVNI